MINMNLNRKVFLEKTIRVLTDEAKAAFEQAKGDVSMSSLVAYTQPEQIPGGYGVVGFMIIMDHSSKISEISPELIIEGNSSDYMNKILRSNMENDLGITRRQVAVTIGSHGAVSSLISLYNMFANTPQLTSITNVDVRGIMSIVAELISEDLNYINEYLKATGGDLNRFIFEGGGLQTPIGIIIKQGNMFEFPDGIIINANSVFRKPDGSFAWDYSVGLGNELMRAAKDDGAFTSKMVNGYNYNPGGNPGGYGNPGGGYGGYNY